MLGSLSPVQVVPQSCKQVPVLQLDLLLRLFPCLGTLDELVCSSGMGLPEETSQEDFSFAKVGLVSGHIPLVGR